MTKADKRENIIMVDLTVAILIFVHNDLQPYRSPASP